MEHKWEKWYIDIESTDILNHQDVKYIIVIGSLISMEIDFLAQIKNLAV